MKTIKDKILSFAKNKGRFRTADIELPSNQKYSRQYLSKILADLVRDGLLVKSGSTKESKYELATINNLLEDSLFVRLDNKNLEEDAVLRRIEEKYDWIKDFSDNAGSIFYYAFTEMLNNAIEHSQSKAIDVSITRTNNSLVFNIRDFGIGVFRNVQSKKHLDSETDAIIELLKGKTTTIPKSHSGEGIFFTSKVAEVFELESFGLKLRIDNKINDIFVKEQVPKIKGTRVIFTLNLPTKKHLNDVFKKFQTDPEEFAFDTTEIIIKLYTIGGIYISRSQARRMLSGLEKFKRVILDFNGVSTVGQAFADEVFRVFKLKHPEVEMVPINMNKSAEFMVRRVEEPKM